MSCKNAKWVDWKSSNQICGDIQMVLSCHCKSSNQISDDIKKMLSVSPIINQSDLRLHLDDVVCVIFCQKQLMRSITRSATFHQNQNNSGDDCNQHNSSQSWANDQSRLVGGTWTGAIVLRSYLAAFLNKIWNYVFVTLFFSLTKSSVHTHRVQWSEALTRSQLTDLSFSTLVH